MDEDSFIDKTHKQIGNVYHKKIPNPQFPARIEYECHRDPFVCFHTYDDFIDYELKCHFNCHELRIYDADNIYFSLSGNGYIPFCLQGLKISSYVTDFPSIETVRIRPIDSDKKCSFKILSLLKDYTTPTPNYDSSYKQYEPYCKYICLDRGSSLNEFKYSCDSKFLAGFSAKTYKMYIYFYEKEKIDILINKGRIEVPDFSTLRSPFVLNVDSKSEFEFIPKDLKTDFSLKMVVSFFQMEDCDINPFEPEDIRIGMTD